MSKWLNFIILSAFLALGDSTAVQAVDLLSTHPSHYSGPRGAAKGSGSSITKRTKQVRGGSNVVVRDDGALVERWRLNPDLSRACNQRLFRQKRDQLLVGVVEGRTYGAAVGGHASLVDRVKMSEKQVIYLFRGQGTTDCRVYHRTK